MLFSSLPPTHSCLCNNSTWVFTVHPCLAYDYHNFIHSGYCRFHLWSGWNVVATFFSWLISLCHMAHMCCNRILLPRTPDTHMTFPMHDPILFRFFGWFCRIQRYNDFVFYNFFYRAVFFPSFKYRLSFHRHRNFFYAR